MQLYKHDIRQFKASINSEKVIYLNFNYLSHPIEQWWSALPRTTPLHLAKYQLISLFLEHCRKKDVYYFDKLGTLNISAICITHIFHQDCERLAFVVHEALSELFALNDIKYPYEEHKKLYLKPNGVNYKDWGNGYGEITPHSDDLYEEIDSDFLSLTVCRDQTNTPTVFYFPKDILKGFNDEELLRLFDMKVQFISGKNVNGLKYRERNIVEFNAQQGFKFYLDFRIDNETGERMRPLNEQDKKLINKMRKNLSSCPYKKSISETGTFIIVANHKVLHARSQMNLDLELAKKISSQKHQTSTPRLLYRSKGQNAKISENTLRG